MRAVYINGRLVSPELLHTHCRGELKTSSQDTTTLATSGQWYKINGTYSDGHLSCFELDVGGTLTYTGAEDVTLLFNGTSNLEADRVCTITYGLFLNGELYGNASSPVSILAANRSATNAITSYIGVESGNEFEVHAKSDTANTVLTPNALSITMDGHF